MPSVSVIIPVHNGGDDLRRCFEGIRLNAAEMLECIVVDDCSSDGMARALADEFGFTYMATPRQSGPGQARNLGAAQAAGEILFFTDADVVLGAGVLAQAQAHFSRHPEVAAVFGSYDDSPGHPGFLSRYRNLYHHWTHQTGRRQASTFWTGCGAIRRQSFLQQGGFDARYERPSIEDIELGYRLRAAGQEIHLLRDMQCCHLKHWTLADMVRTDVFQRGIPWVVLLQRFPDVPSDLNLNWRARLATVAAGLLLLVVAGVLLFSATDALPFFGFLLASLVAAQWKETSRKNWRAFSVLLLAVSLTLSGSLYAAGPLAWLPFVPLAVMVACQWGFYRTVCVRQDLGFALACWPVQWLFFLGCAISVPLGYIKHLQK